MARRGHAAPKWAWFLDGKDVDVLAHKQLKGACKKARVSAAGSSDALRRALRSYLARDDAPAWFVDGMQDGLSAAACATRARTVAFAFGGDAEVCMRVGQRLEYLGEHGKCKGRHARLVAGSDVPAGCLAGQHQSSQAGSRSGFIGGRVTDKAEFVAKAPGTAKVALLVWTHTCSEQQSSSVTVVISA